MQIPEGVQVFPGAFGELGQQPLADLSQHSLFHIWFMVDFSHSSTAA